jgi:hypothetical protein
MRCWAQICPTIVQTIAILVVNLVAWVVPGHHLPDDAVGAKMAVLNAHLKVEQPGFCDSNGADRLAEKSSLPSFSDTPSGVFAIRPLKMSQRPVFPSQNATVRSIREALVQVRLIWQDTFSHGVLRQGCVAKGDAGAGTLASPASYNPLT